MKESTGEAIWWGIGGALFVAFVAFLYSMPKPPPVAVSEKCCDACNDTFDEFDRALACCQICSDSLKEF